MGMGGGNGKIHTYTYNILIKMGKKKKYINVPAHFCGGRQVSMTALCLMPLPVVQLLKFIHPALPSVCILVSYTKGVHHEKGIWSYSGIGVKDRFAMDWEWKGDGK